MVINYRTLFTQTKNLSLLLVEDYEPLRNDMGDVLKDLFKTVTVASDGSKALKLYQEYYSIYGKSFNLVISDIQMPEMDGVDLSESLLEINTDQKIIILSAHTDSEYLLRLINLGIAQFLTKPIKHEELMETLYNVSKEINATEEEPKNVSILDLGENYTWDKKKLLLKQNENIVKMTRHKIYLMQLLVQKSGQICTNYDIMFYFDAKGIDIDGNGIRNLVLRLRKNLPDNIIKSIYGIGYKLQL